MRHPSNRRDFLKRIIKGTFISAFFISLIKPEKTFAWLTKSPFQNKSIPRINPAYKVNAFKNGTVELYTNTVGGEKKSTTFSDLKADILLQIVHQKNPNEYNETLGNKYSLAEEEYTNQVSEFLNDLENKGFIYYGELMLVKVKKDNGK